jgi:hypothetical protein
MPVHDWTRVSAGVFHDFHVAWIGELRKALNRGILPEGYYALAEQVSGEIWPDVLTLKTGEPPAERRLAAPAGATAVKEAPPRVHTTAVADELELYSLRRRTLTIRYSGDDRIVAIVEILSRGNKERRRALERFLDKAYSALRSGIHLLLADVFPPGPYDPQGIHAALWAELDRKPYEPPRDRPLTIASYAAGSVPRAYVEPVAVGSLLPDMPLFLDEDWYVNVPLEPTYVEATLGVPAKWREVLER